MLQRKQRPRLALEIRAAGVPFWARLYHADSLNVLGGIERPDLIVTDPPYGDDEGRHDQYGRMENDKDLGVVYEVIALAIRKLKPEGHVYSFSSRKHPFDLERAGGKLVKVLGALAWVKSKGNQGTFAWMSTWDYVAWGKRLPDFTDPEDVGLLRAMDAQRRAAHEEEREKLRRAFEDGDQDVLQEMLKRIPDPEPINFSALALPLARDRAEVIKAIRVMLSERQADRGRVRRYSDLPYPRRDRSKLHPTEKPIAMLKELIGVSSRPYDLVLDPFAGSGSTGVAALELGRRFIGIERENTEKQPYVRRVVERLKATRCRSPEEVWAEEARWSQKEVGPWWEQFPEAIAWLEQHPAPAREVEPAKRKRRPRK